MKYVIGILGFLTWIGFFAGCVTGDEYRDLYVVRGTTMGTIYTVKIVHENFSENQLTKMKKGIEECLEAVNRQMSVFNSNSELSKFNRYRDTDWFGVSIDTVKVIEQSIAISEKSNGAFDITVGPLVNLWGFGPGIRARIVPEDEKIKGVLKNTGYKNISVKFSPPSVKKNIAGIECNLSAIAKGYGVDQIAEYLDKEKIGNYLIEIGGEIRVKGTNRQNKVWRIGIATPEHGFGIQKVISLRDMSMATSGDYRNFFEKNGIRFSHTIDPRTGKPIGHNLVSVTVIYDSCTVADAMATAINVMGPDEGYKLALKEKLAVFMIVKHKTGFIEKITPEFKRILKPKD